MSKFTVTPLKRLVLVFFGGILISAFWYMGMLQAEYFLEQGIRTEGVITDIDIDREMGDEDESDKYYPEVEYLVDGKLYRVFQESDCGSCRVGDFVDILVDPADKESFMFVEDANPGFYRNIFYVLIFIFSIFTVINFRQYLKSRKQT